ncbi:RNA polymerase sigma factor [Baekduia sp.]|uniref:RNA polymerase sigma factor n=1 Tax=Baekduia sp. TaxID=2600305 RepID=UPI002D1FAF03|nr:RNA polymerase sigma factor [Baekduia sp.]
MPLTADDIAGLFDRHHRDLLRFLVRRTWNPDVAVELLAETFARALESGDEFRGGGDQVARGWVFGIARHLTADFVRHGQAERRAIERLGIRTRNLSDDEYERIEDLASSGGLRADVARAVGELPDDQRAAIELRIVQERPYREVAELLGISQEAARTRVSRGLGALRTQLLPTTRTLRTDHV